MTATPGALVFLAGRVPLQGPGCLPPHQGEVGLSPGLGVSSPTLHLKWEFQVPSSWETAFCTVPVPWTQGSGAMRKTVGSPWLLFPGSGLLASQVGSGAQLPGVHPGPPAQASPPTWRRSRSAGCEGPGRWGHQAADGAKASAASASHGGNGAGSQAHTGAHAPREA